MVITESAAEYKYCENLTGFMRIKTREVMIGNVPLGGKNPVRIQSMTNTSTNDVDATVAQTIRLADAGCEYVRITAQGVKEAENLRVIKKKLISLDYHVPLIADIHFNPHVAEIAARYVEKVRINPGNYTDKNKLSGYSSSEYDLEIEKIRARLTPLIYICKQHNTTIRIGSNHGSLSGRILDRYGDTPNGMVEAALEFIRICRENDFHKLVVSMKSSNVKIMIESTRLLVSRMMAEGMDYPVHLGVTEAGDGEDGRIKSAAGIGSLLEDGIGDTLRVSLTEDPEAEIPVARMLADYYANRTKSTEKPKTHSLPYNPFSFQRRGLRPVNNIGGGFPPVVITCREDLKNYTDVCFKMISSLADLKKISSSDRRIKNTVFIINSAKAGIKKERNLIIEMMNSGTNVPVIIKRKYNCTAEELVIRASADYGSLLADGLIDGMWIDAPDTFSSEKREELSLGILQATGARISKAEFISCPSCGRTTYNIQKSLKNIKARTSHLKGLKIGVMGCIVNGPGEMADAHYGYVGSGKGKITLYKGKKVVRKNIDEDFAVEELVELIKNNGDWKEQ